MTAVHLLPVQQQPTDPAVILSHGTILSLLRCPHRVALRHQLLTDGHPVFPSPPAERWRNLQGSLAHELISQLLHLERGRKFNLRRARARAHRALAPATRVALESLEKNTRVSQKTARQLVELAFSAKLQMVAQRRALRMLENASLVGLEIADGPGASSRCVSEPELIDVEVTGQRFYGRPDLVVLEDGVVRVIDFKTAQLKSESPEVFAERQEKQLRLYAALWHRQHGGSHFVLQVVRPGGTYEVAALSEQELDSWVASQAKQWATLTERAMAGQPSLGAHCSACSVRAGCDTYWGQLAPFTGATGRAWGDVMLRVDSSRRDDGSYPVTPLSTLVQGRAAPESVPLLCPEYLEQGATYRALGLELRWPEQADPVLIVNEPARANAFRGGELWRC